MPGFKLSAQLPVANQAAGVTAPRHACKPLGLITRDSYVTLRRGLVRAVPDALGQLGEAY